MVLFVYKFNVVEDMLAIDVVDRNNTVLSIKIVCDINDVSRTVRFRNFRNFKRDIRRSDRRRLI